MLRVKDQLILMGVLILTYVLREYGHSYGILVVAYYFGHFFVAASIHIQMMIESIRVTIIHLLIQSVQIGIGAGISIFMIQLFQQTMNWHAIAYGLITPLVIVVASLNIALIGYVENIPFRKVVIGMLWITAYIYVFTIRMNMYSIIPSLYTLMLLLMVTSYILFRIRKIKYLI